MVSIAVVPPPASTGVAGQPAPPPRPGLLGREPAHGGHAVARPVEPAGWRVVDGVLQAYLDTHGDIPDRWLLIQTLATAAMRRGVLASLGVQPGWRTLDIGTGFGALPMELAAMVPVDAVGVDLDGSIVRVAEALRADVERQGGLLPGSRVGIVTGDAYALDQPDATVDLATARFLLQHLRDPAGAASEVARVVRPGGLACLIDVDDGLSVTHPEPSAAFVRLRDALTAQQGHVGAGRTVGRTMPALLDAAGFEVLAVIVLPQAAYRSSQPGDLTRTHLVERFRAARPELVDRYISADEFDDCLGRFASEVTPGECVVEAHLAVVGRRR